MAAENLEGGAEQSSAPNQTATSAKSSLVGCRIRVSGNAATVRWGPGHVQAPPSKRPAAEDTGYSGEQEAAPQAPATVEVVGIEYDQPGFGKHDGTHQGERLFTCKSGHGSFVKMEKLSLGVSMQWAIADKYFTGLLPEAANRHARSEAVDNVDYVDSKGRNKHMTVELVGRYNVEQHQQRLEAFVEASLADSCLESRYPDNVWDGDWSLPNLKSLWLDKTLLSDWADIIAICELCPQLEWLSLAKNRLAPVPPNGVLNAARGAPENPRDMALVVKPFTSKVRTLVLTETGVTWQDVLVLDRAGHLPCLENLHLARNGLSEGIPDIEDGGALLPRLRSLVLDHNEISDWRVLRRAITAFPSLEDLHLNGNRLGDTLEGLAEMAADETPRRLVGLFLAENCISSWQAIGALSSYALLELKSQRNPLTEGESPVASSQLLRQVIIALMPTLMRLNASEVPQKERTAAERYFLTLVKQDSPVVKALGEGCDIAVHAARLREKHGDVVGGAVTEEEQASRAALVNNLVEVTLRPIGAAILEQPEAKKRLPHTMTVVDLKRLCHSIFKKVPLDRLRLVLADPGLPFGLPFDDESRELGFYGVADGAEIRVDDLNDQNFGEREIKRVSNLADRLVAAPDDADDV